jgi:hypothetical protein
MSKIPPPMDCMGNELRQDDLVVFHPKRVCIAKVIAVEPGGIHTTNGVTPVVVRVVIDITLKQMPGIPFDSLAKVVQPDAQKLVEAISDFLPRT